MTGLEVLAWGCLALCVGAVLVGGAMSLFASRRETSEFGVTIAAMGLLLAVVYYVPMLLLVDWSNP